MSRHPEAVADSPAVSEISALDVLKAGACSPVCLLSPEGRCHCRCGGTYHGLILDSLTRADQDTVR